jgi:hypothetical protein
LLIQLRSHYPAGCLRSELVQVEAGSYVVRAMVEVEGVVIATGMAAAATIDQAEDQARARVMAVMGLTPLSLPEPKLESAAARIPDVVPATMSVVVPEPVAVMPTAVAPIAVPLDPEPIAPETAMAELDADDGTQAETKSTKSKAKSTKSKAAPKLDLVPPPEPLVEMTGGADATDEDEIEYEFTIEGDDGPDPTDAMTEAPPLEPTIDLSDAIAQIGAEIERIGWTKKQGSAYLQEAYSKRTRAELSETELLSFLHYLKALPSKLQPALSDLPF